MVQFNEGSFDCSKVKKPAYVDAVRFVRSFLVSITSVMIPLTILFAVLSYVFGLGEWTFAGRELVVWFHLSLHALLILAILAVSMGETAKWLCVRAIHILFFEPALKIDFDNNPALARVFNAMRTRYLITAVCSFLSGVLVFFWVYGLLAETVGWPWAEIACFLIVLIAPTLVGGILSLPVLNRAVPSNLPSGEREDYRQSMWMSDDMAQRLFLGR